MLLIGLILAIVFLLAVMKWWSEGMFEASDAVLLVVVFGGLIFGLFAARHWWEFLIAFIPLVAAGSYAVYSFRSGSLRSYFRKRCSEYMRAIQFDPRNLGAREALADTLYNLGDLDRAIDEMQVAVDMGAGMECQYRLSKWSKERYARDSLNPVCKWCGTEGIQGARACVRCGSELPYENSLSRWLTGGKTSGSRYYLIVIFGVGLVGISLLLLPLRFAFIPVVLFTVALAGWGLLASSRG